MRETGFGWSGRGKNRRRANGRIPPSTTKPKAKKETLWKGAGRERIEAGKGWGRKGMEWEEGAACETTLSTAKQKSRKRNIDRKGKDLRETGFGWSGKGMGKRKSVTASGEKNSPSDRKSKSEKEVLSREGERLAGERCFCWDRKGKGRNQAVSVCASVLIWQAKRQTAGISCLSAFCRPCGLISRHTKCGCVPMSVRPPRRSARCPPAFAGR